MNLLCGYRKELDSISILSPRLCCLILDFVLTIKKYMATVDDVILCTHACRLSFMRIDPYAKFVIDHGALSLNPCYLSPTDINLYPGYMASTTNVTFPDVTPDDKNPDGCARETAKDYSKYQRISRDTFIGMLLYSQKSHSMLMIEITAV